MNVVEMQYNFGMQMNQFDSALQLNSDDILWWLNRAQEQFIKRRYEALDPLKRKERQEQNKFDDIRSFVIKDKSLDVVYVPDDAAFSHLKAEKSEIPPDYMHLISLRAEVYYNFPEIEFTITNDKRSPEDEFTQRISLVRFSQTDDIYELLSDPFNKTKPDSPITDVNEETITIYTDKTFLVNKLLINYLKRPRTLTLNEVTVDNPDFTNESELPKHTHEEIIDLAVTLFLHNTRELKERLQRETPVAEQQQSQQ